MKWGKGVLERGFARIAVGLRMIPRGEVGLIFARIGASLMLHSTPVIDSRPRLLFVRRGRSLVYHLIYSCCGSVYFPRFVVEGRQWWFALITAQAL